jgi:hypothetical protein
MDENYIKMCWNAWDDLEEHIPHEPDELWCDGNSVFIRTPIIDAEGWIQSGKFVDHIVYKLSEPFPCEEFIVWRQEDLQDIYLVYLKDLSKHPQSIEDNYFLSTGFVKWYNSPTNAKLTTNQAWLSYIMETCYGKTHVGEEWVEL